MPLDNAGVNGLVELVNSIEDEEQLRRVNNAVRGRHKVLRATAAAAVARGLAPGATVRFKSNIKPNYLAGLCVEVKRVNQQTVTVDCPDDPAFQRFAGEEDVRVRLTTIEEVIPDVNDDQSGPLYAESQILGEPYHKTGGAR